MPLLQDPVKRKDKDFSRDDKWTTITILLFRGTVNLVQVEMQQYDLCVLSKSKRQKKSEDCGKTFTQEWIPETLKVGSETYRGYIWHDGTNELCTQFMFEPYYEDTKIDMYMPKEYQRDFKITLKEAKIVD